MPVYRVIRITMPDRPGALSAVTASLAAHRVDIVRLDVVSHDGGSVVDDLLLAAESADDITRASAGFLSEVTVRTFEGLPGDPTIEMGTGLRRVAGAAPREAAMALVDAAATLLRADHAVLLAAGPDGELSALAATFEVPAVPLEAPFAGRWALERGTPLAFPASDGWAPAELRQALGAAWVAVVPCGELRLLLVSRSLSIAFYSGELERLHAFAEAADQVLRLHGEGAALGTAPAGPWTELPVGAIELDGRVPVR